VKAPRQLPRAPALCFPVSEYIHDEMEARGWTADQLADAARLSRTALTALLEQDAPLTDEQAVDLERAFGVSSQFWMNLEIAYRRWKNARRRRPVGSEQP
jgi:HTH-type transcriptional regulator/antitoxin HigA